MLLPLDEQAVRRGVQRLKALGVQSIAIMFLFSYVNPAHERPRGRDRARGVSRRRARVAVTRGHGPRARVRARVHHPGERLRRTPDLGLRVAAPGEAPQRGLRRSGADHAVHRRCHAPRLRRQSARSRCSRRAPPAASWVRPSRRRASVCATSSRWTWAVPASTCASSAAGARRSRPIGTGGTGTTSACRWSTCRASVRAAARSRGCVRVRCSSGPESAGSTPGPVCYGRGGTRPTVTDADAVLGYIPAQGFASGRMELDVESARAAIEREVAEPLGLDTGGCAAWGVERIVNANMANETRRVLASHGADPRTLSIIAYGGNGAVHAWAIAAELGIDHVLIPKAAPAFSALGVLVADYVVDLLRAYVVPLSQIDLAQVHALSAELQDEAAKELEPTGLPDARDRPRSVRTDVLPGAELRHERAGDRGRRARRARAARPRGTVPRPARGRARVRVPQPAAAAAGDASHRTGPHAQAVALRRAR